MVVAAHGLPHDVAPSLADEDRRTSFIVPELRVEFDVVIGSLTGVDTMQGAALLWLGWSMVDCWD